MNASMLQMVASVVGRILGPRHQAPAAPVDIDDHAWNGRNAAYSLSSILPGLSLSARFGFAAAVVLCNGMALLGGWVGKQIEWGLVQNTAIAESAYLQSLFSPFVPLIAAHESTAAQIAGPIDNALQSTPLRSRTTSVAIWKPDGTIISSTDKSLLGRKFTLPSGVSDAFSGEVRATLSDRRLPSIYLDRPDAGPERTVYTPLREKDGGKVVAVVETVTDASALKAQLDSIRKRTWIVVGLSTLLMIGLLFGIVHNGSQTIEAQRSEINRRLDEEIRLGQVNKALSERLQEANKRGIELGEEQLRRISSDLENGPVQLLALALLRMYELKPDEDQGETDTFQSVADVVDVIAHATSDAMKELRGIASGLPLPELQRFSSSEAVERAIRTHERTTGTVVERNISALPPDLPLPVSICIFRVVQEGLTNAYCHAGGLGQTITGSYEDDTVIITVSDDGPGFFPQTALKPGSNLGLRWLRQRVESIGGTLTIQSAEGEGTQLIAQFPYAFPASEVKDVS